MKKINILWLYDDLLDLYGDSGNISVITYYLTKVNISYQIDKKSINDKLSFDYDLIYIGCGKLKNLVVANEHLKSYKEAFNAAIKQDKIIIMTGNSQLMLGKSITTKENMTYEGLNIFDFESFDNNEVYISDVIASSELSSNAILYGFINRTSYIQPYDNKYPFLTIEQGLGDISMPTEERGIAYHNLLATWLLGPLLVKNPSLLETILKRLISSEDTIELETLQYSAYEMTINEFK